MQHSALAIQKRVSLYRLTHCLGFHAQQPPAVTVYRSGGYLGQTASGILMRLFLIVCRCACESFVVMKREGLEFQIAGKRDVKSSRNEPYQQRTVDSGLRWLKEAILLHCPTRSNLS